MATSAVRSRTIAFIGLGIMGSPMAANLVRAGHTVIGYDRGLRRWTASSGREGRRRTVSLRQ